MAKNKDETQAAESAGINLPKNHAYKGSIKPRIGHMFAQNDEGKRIAVEVQNGRFDARLGAVSNHLKPSAFKNPDEIKEKDAGKQQNVHQPNLIHNDHAYLPCDYDTLVVKTGFNITADSLTAYALNSPEMREYQRAFTQAMIAKGGYRHLAERYLNNIINLRWMHRNRESVKLHVEISVEGEDIVLSTPVDRHYKRGDYRYVPGYEALLDRFEQALTTPYELLMLNVSGFSRCKGGAQVYPSQLIENEAEMKEAARSEMKRDGRRYRFEDTEHSERHAIMTDYKIGNGVRQIDDWYSRFESNEQRVLPVEPYGVDRYSSRAQRLPETEEDFYSLLLKLPEITEKVEQCTEIKEVPEALFALAVLIRGGLFSENSK